MKLIKHQQNSKDWLEWRRKGLGASDACIVMGVSEYKTRHQLFQNKLGLTPDEPESFITEMGHHFEPIARARYALETGVDLIADVCGEHDEFPWLRASFDGLCDEERVFAEIKMMGKKKLATVRETKKPLDEHFPQCQQQFLVSGFERGVYIAYSLSEDKKSIDDYECVSISPDRVYIDKMFQELQAFWKLVETQTPPELEARDEYVFKDKQSLSLVKQYAVQKALIKEHQEKLEQIETELKARAAAHPVVRIGQMVISTVIRQGNVDYKKIPQLKGVDLEQFRNKPTSYKKIDLKG